MSLTYDITLALRLIHDNHFRDIMEAIDKTEPRHETHLKELERVLNIRVYGLFEAKPKSILELELLLREDGLSAPQIAQVIETATER